jgi:hypothetical protein
MNALRRKVLDPLLEYYLILLHQGQLQPHSPLLIFGQCLKHRIACNELVQLPEPISKLLGFVYYALLMWWHV